MANKSCSLNSNKICSQINKLNQCDIQKSPCISTARFKPRSTSEIQKSTMNKSKYLPTKFHYVRSLNESCLAQYFKHSIQNSNIANNNSVTKWLQDLRMMSENECLCVLQAKSLSSKLNQFRTEKINNQTQNFNLNCKVILPEVTIHEFIELAIQKKHFINEDLSAIIKLEKISWQNIAGSLAIIINNIQLIIDLFNKINCLSLNSIKTESNFQIKDFEEKLIANIHTIQKILNKVQETNNHNLNTTFLNNFHQIFQNYFNCIIHVCLSKQLEKLNKSESLDSIRTVLNQLLELSLKIELAKKIIINENGIICLFNTLKDPFYKEILDLILRTLSILCSDVDSLNSLKKINCFSILTDILCDEQASEWTRTECAGCVAQITSPYLDFCENLKGFLDNIEDLIRALTILCRDSSDIEIFLIGTAALANITFLDKIACEYLNQFGTAQVLIENYYLKQYNSIFVKDQITTILANMALIENCRYDISEFNGLNLLIDFLNERPINYMNLDSSKNSIESELNACERVQQKAAIAISRFCKEPKYTSQLIDLGVISRISFLCRNANERNNSDSVLVACLAALRQIAVSSETLESSDLLIEADIQQLIKPKTNESFLQSSSNEESYV